MFCDFCYCKKKKHSHINRLLDWSESLPFGTQCRAEPLWPFEDVGKVYLATQLAGQHWPLLAFQIWKTQSQSYMVSVERNGHHRQTEMHRFSCISFNSVMVAGSFYSMCVILLGGWACCWGPCDGLCCRATFFFWLVQHPLSCMKTHSLIASPRGNKGQLALHRTVAVFRKPAFKMVDYFDLCESRAGP